MARTSLQVMRDTVFALMMRELKTRFGARKLGYFWALAEPAAQALILSTIFTLVGRNTLTGVPVAIFMLSGILPYKFFSKLLPQLTASVHANRSLFAYRQVAPIDPLITRLFIEFATHIVVYVLIMSAMAWIGYDVWPEDLLSLLLATLLLTLIGTGLGLMLCSAMSHWEDTPKVLQMVMTPMFFVSGIFFCATMVPQQYWYLLTWNPIFHVTELSRDAYFASYTTPVGSWAFLMATALVTNALGLMLYQVNRQRFISA